MFLSFRFLGYTSIDMLQDLSGSMFSIEPSELVQGTIGIASALDESINADMLPDCPDELDPKATDESGRFVYEAEYKELYEECKSAQDWQTECNPDGDFEELYFWVRVYFE